jgi:hypothetical protein
MQTGSPREFMGLHGWLRANPREACALRRAGRSTARRYAWPEVLERVLLPRVDLDHEIDLPVRHLRRLLGSRDWLTRSFGMESRS